MTNTTETNDWRERRARRQLNASASQFETFNTCARKWWLEKVRGLPGGTSKSQVFGTVVHGVIERYLRADDLGRGPNGLTGDDLLYPEGWQIATSRFGAKCQHCKDGTEPKAGIADCPHCYGTGLECEGRIDPAQEADVKRLIKAAIDSGVLERLPGRVIEQGFNRQIVKTPCVACDGTGKNVKNWVSGGEEEKCAICKGDGHGCTVMMVGFIDVAFKDAIHDHKTTKSMRYAKSPAKLAENTQMLIYAHEILEQARDRGEPLPQNVTLRHNVYCAQENKVRKTEVVVTREKIESAWAEIVRNAHKMAELRSMVNVWHEIHDPADASYACNAYGGCPFRSVCSGQETEEMFEKRVARQKELLYSPESKVAMQGVSPTIQPVIKGTTTVENFADRLAKMKNRNAAGATPGAPPPAAVQTPSTPAVSTTPAAPPPNAPAVTTTAPAAAPSTTPALPPIAPVEVAGVGVVQPPPWAVQGCNGCQGVGFTTKGTPCRICDMKSKMANRPVSGNYTLESLEDGMIMWVSKENPDKSGVSFITGRPAENVKTQVREATAPVSVTPVRVPPPPAPVETPAPVSAPQTLPVSPANPDDGISPNAPAVTTTAPAPTIPAGASPLPAEALTTEQNAAAEPLRRKRRTKAEMAADAAVKNGAATVNNSLDANVAEGFTLLIGCVLAGQRDGVLTKGVDFMDVFNGAAAQVAAHNNAASYWALDPFKRRDMLALMAPVMAEELDGFMVVADAQTPDTRAFLEALRTHANMVIVATK